MALDYGGYLSEVHNGDFLLAFEEAKDALLFAVDAQEACETMPWQSRAGEISPRTPSPHIPYASPRVPYPRRDRPLSPQPTTRSGPCVWAPPEELTTFVPIAAELELAVFELELLVFPLD